MSKKQSQILEAYELSKKNKKKARTIITIAMVFSVLCATWCLYSSSNRLISDSSGELASELKTQLTPIAEANFTKAASIANEVYPSYTKAFSSMLEESIPKFESELFEEVKTLTRFAESKKPDFEKISRETVASLVATVDQNLQKVASKEVAQKVSKQYEAAISKYLNNFFLENLVEHQNVIDEIQVNLEKFDDSSKGKFQSVEIHQAVGTFLELAGLKLQNLDNNTDGEI